MSRSKEVNQQSIDAMILEQNNERLMGVRGKVLPDDFMSTEVEDAAGVLKPKEISVPGSSIWKAFETFHNESPDLQLKTFADSMIVELFRVRSEDGITKNRDNKKIYQYKVFNFGRIHKTIHTKEVDDCYALLGVDVTLWGVQEAWTDWHAKITNMRPAPTHLLEPPKFGNPTLCNLQAEYGILQNPAGDFYLGDIFTFSIPIGHNYIKAFQSREFVYNKMKALYGV